VTVVTDHALLKALRSTTSATHTLATHLGHPRLELDRAHATLHHRLTAREREALHPAPGVLYGYHREGFLRTPHPEWRPVAWVTATVLTGVLPPEVAKRVLDAATPLGGLLTAIGARRRCLDVRHERRADYSGQPIFLVSRAVFDFEDRPVAVVTEQVYDWVARP